MSTIPTSLDDVNTRTPTTSAFRTWLVGLLSLTVGAAAAGFLASRDIPRFSGRIEAQTTFVNAAHSGVVTELLVKEGDRVSIEDPLASFTDPELEAQIADQRSAMSVLESQLEQAEAAAEVELSWRIKELDNDIVATELRSADYLKEKFDWQLERSMWADVLSSGEPVSLFHEEEPTFQSVLLKSRVPAEGQMTAMLKHETANNAVAVSSVQVEICQQRLGQLQRIKEHLPERLRQTAGVAVAGAKLTQAQAALERLEARRAALVVQSTAIGTVGLFRARPGDHLQAGEPIVAILDDARRWVVASIASSAVPEFTSGRMMQLTFPGGLVRTGRVVAVAPQADRSPGNELDPPVSVRIEQAAAAWPNVPLGSRVDVQLAE